MDTQAQTASLSIRTHARAAIATLIVAALAAGAFWGYRGQQKRTLDRDVAALVQDSTVRLRDALAMLESGRDARDRLDATHGALAANLDRLRAGGAALNPSLVWAADGYIGEVHALLRRQIEAHRSRDAVRADIREIQEHLRAATHRSSGWIQRALELKKRLEHDYFDFRLASGGLEKSLRSLPDARRDLEPLVAPDTLIDAQTLSSAATRWQSAAKQLNGEVEKARDLPEPS